jgi:hypothetical protein
MTHWLYEETCYVYIMYILVIYVFKILLYHTVTLCVVYVMNILHYAASSDVYVVFYNVLYSSILSAAYRTKGTATAMSCDSCLSQLKRKGGWGRKWADSTCG